MYIVEKTRQRLTPNRYFADYKPGMIKDVEGLVYHFTVSESTTGTVGWLCNPVARASADFVIGRDGEIWQLAPLLDDQGRRATACWHAGGPSSSFLGARNTNGRTIGIELVNWGPLFRNSDGKLVTSGRPRIFNGDVFDAGESPSWESAIDESKADASLLAMRRARFWEAFSAAQVDAAEALTRRLADLFPAIASDPRSRLVSHSDVDPMRKVDAGPAFPIGRMRQAIMRGGRPSGCKLTL